MCVGESRGGLPTGFTRKGTERTEKAEGRRFGAYVDEYSNSRRDEGRISGVVRELLERLETLS